jgi:hypothetical protein
MDECGRLAESSMAAPVSTAERGRGMGLLPADGGVGGLRELRGVNSPSASKMLVSSGLVEGDPSSLSFAKAVIASRAFSSSRAKCAPLPLVVLSIDAGPSPLLEE